jgi:hypothetical protein
MSFNMYLKNNCELLYIENFLMVPRTRQRALEFGRYCHKQAIEQTPIKTKNKKFIPQCWLSSYSVDNRK